MKVDIRRDACRVPHCTQQVHHPRNCLRKPGGSHSKGYLVGFEDDNVYLLLSAKGVKFTPLSLPRSQESYTVFSKLMYQKHSRKFTKKKKE